MPNSSIVRPIDDLVARPQPANLDRRAVHARAVGAVEVGQDDVAVFHLDLGVEPADALVVEPQAVAFLAADGDGDWEVLVDPALVHAFEDEESDGSHGVGPVAWRRGHPVVPR